MDRDKVDRTMQDSNRQNSNGQISNGQERSRQGESRQSKSTPEVQILEEMVGYQEGSIVSREIIRKPTGTVTLFAFDEGQGLSEHIAPFDALVHILDGEAKVSISVVSYHLKRGEMAIMPANQTHALRALSRFKMMLVMIRS